MHINSMLEPLWNQFWTFLGGCFSNRYLIKGGSIHIRSGDFGIGRYGLGRLQATSPFSKPWCHGLEVPSAWCGGSWLGCAVVPVMGALLQSRRWLPIVEAPGYSRHPTSILAMQLLNAFKCNLKELTTKSA